MKEYLVGGAVRDMIMGRNPKDFDWVVVGSTPEEMLANGFTQVGADFPVFIHPVNGDEYALARTERKSGKGYGGFTVDFNPEITIESDLERRDLTINSIAQGTNEPNSPDGKRIYIDPFGGIEDIKNKILRHTSEAFVEDPVRVLRVARFAAQFGDGWKVHGKTMNLMMKLVDAGELDHLTTERVFGEFKKAMMGEKPSRFFRILRDCGALKILFPEVHALIGVIQPEQWHPEGDAFEHTMLVLDSYIPGYDDFNVRLACLVHDFGKALTPREKLPSHPGHDVAGVDPAKNFVKRLGMSNDIADYVGFICRYHMMIHQAKELRGKTYVKIYEAAKSGHKMEWIDELTAVGVCDEIGSMQVTTYNPSFFFQVMDCIDDIEGKDVFTIEQMQNMDGEKIKEGIRRARITAADKKIKELKN